ncbi:MAG: hypothetical protein E7496_11005, partial [Ruminococcus sp.]|nr:hypothetical protein [Ruminococcus sp.]
MTANNTKNKSTAKRKLVPAVGMLLASAMALSSSTYAWFTMSREVEVTGIKLTATVPENIEISLGYDQHTGNHLAQAATQPAAYDGYNASNGWLQLVKAPENSVDSQDWSNSVAFCNFYDVGKLLPASSTDGVSIFYTGNAVNTGENVSDTSTFTLANNFTDKKLAQTTTLLKNEGATYYAGAFTSSAFDPDKAKTGYYVDFPIWIRTSSDSEINLVVDATISDGDTASETLYRAARVAILNADGTVVTSTNEVTATGWATKQGLLYDDYSNNDYTLDATLTRPYTVASTVDGSGNVTTINYTPYAASSALTTRLVANSTNAVAANYQDTLRYFNRYTGITGNQAVVSAGTADASSAVNTFYDAITRFTQATKDASKDSGYAETTTGSGSSAVTTVNG